MLDIEILVGVCDIASGSVYCMKNEVGSRLHENYAVFLWICCDAAFAWRKRGRVEGYPGKLCLHSGVGIVDVS